MNDSSINQATDEAWKIILASATLGTERAPYAPDTILYDGLLSPLSQHESERALLGATGAISLYQRVGRIPVIREDRDFPNPCEPDALPRCSPAAARYLRLMLQGENREVLPEWLAALHRAGLRVPEEFLPDLLELGAKSEDLRPLILLVLGKRGEWLAELNSDWRYARAEKLDESIWETGDRKERLAYLRRLRELDADRAREIVASSWMTEAPEDRAIFIQAFETNLSMSDEPFLEDALDDRRKEVRKSALNLLARLPESRLSRRMKERLRPLLIWTVEKRGFMGIGEASAKLIVNLPTECDKGMVRDGVERKPGWGYEAGERQWWLQQMIAAIHPDHWTLTQGVSPDEILRSVSKNEFKSILTRGWSAAAVYHSATNWIVSLLDSWKEGTIVIEDLTDLVFSLPKEPRESFLTWFINNNSYALNYGRIYQTFYESQEQWGEALSRAMLEAIRSGTEVSNSQRNSALYFSPSKDFGRFLSLSLLNEAMEDWPVNSDIWPHWRGEVDRMLGLMQFRYDMLKELSS